MSKSSITTSIAAPKNGMRPVHPGKILRDDFMHPMKLSANALAKSCNVPTNRITAIINGTRSITAETALLLSARFGNSAQYWLNLQNFFDMRTAESNKKFMKTVAAVAAAVAA